MNIQEIKKSKLSVSEKRKLIMELNSTDEHIIREQKRIQRIKERCAAKSTGNHFALKGISVRQSRLNVRVRSEVKEALERLQDIFGCTQADLIEAWVMEEFRYMTEV